MNTVETKRRVLLLVPPNIAYKDFIAPSANVKVECKGQKQFGSVITDMPLGVIALSAYIKKNYSGEVKIVDFNVLLNKLDDFPFSSFDEYFERVLSSEEISLFGPDIIGISALFSTAYSSLLGMGKVCKHLFPKAMVIAGGHVPTVSYREILRETDAFDAICYGEGEIPLLDLLKSDNMYLQVLEDCSWVTKSKLGKKVEYQNKIIYDLDEVPFDYSAINIDDYQINPTVKYYTSVANKGKIFNIMTSRGCPFKCIFCAAHRTHGREMRYESLERVKENIRYLMNEHQVGVVTITDDHFMGDEKRALDIVQYIGELGLTVFFPNSLAMYALDFTMLKALKDASVEQLILAVESGSDRVLKRVMKKPLKLDIVKRVVEDCRQIGIYTDCNVLIGLPGETKSDIDETRSFLRTVGANWFRIFVATPLLGSEMYDICEEKNYFKGVVIEGNFKRAVVETEDFSAEYIQDTTYDMNIELNFVYNFDMVNGHYGVALKGFENALKAKPDHAIALYYAALCYGHLGNQEKSQTYMKLASQYAREPFWAKYIKMFDIPLPHFSD